MEFSISGRNLTISDRFRQYAEEKAGKIEQLVPKIQRLEARVSQESKARQADGSFRAEITVLGKGPVIRAEAAASDKVGAFDQAYAKLLERLRRAKDRKKVHHGRRRPTAVFEATAALPVVNGSEPMFADGESEEPAGPTASAEEVSPYGTDEEIPPPGDSPVVIRRKVFPAAAISVDDAVDNMELVGHDFYLFIDSATNAPAVVYRRRGWSYGVISLDSECTEEEATKAQLLAYRAREEQPVT